LPVGSQLASGPTVASLAYSSLSSARTVVALTRLPFSPQEGQSNRFSTVVAVVMDRPFSTKRLRSDLSLKHIGSSIDVALEYKVKADVTIF
jgi:hypothetical protein